MRTSVTAFQRRGSFVGGNVRCGSSRGNSLFFTSPALSRFLCSTGDVINLIPTQLAKMFAICQAQVLIKSQSQ